MYHSDLHYSEILTNLKVITIFSKSEKVIREKRDDKNFTTLNWSPNGRVLKFYRNS